MDFNECITDEQRAAIEYFNLRKQPPEFFDFIINSGICNKIIGGYILLAFDRAGIEPPPFVTHGVIRNYTAEEARERYKDYSIIADFKRAEKNETEGD